MQLCYISYSCITTLLAVMPLGTLKLHYDDTNAVLHKVSDNFFAGGFVLLYDYKILVSGFTVKLVYLTV